MSDCIFIFSAQIIIILDSTCNILLVKIAYFKNVIALGASAGYVQSCAATDSHGKINTLKLKLNV
jgi:hypothetical protein